MTGLKKRDCLIGLERKADYILTEDCVFCFRAYTKKDYELSMTVQVQYIVVCDLQLYK